MSKMPFLFSSTYIVITPMTIGHMLHSTAERRIKWLPWKLFVKHNLFLCPVKNTRTQAVENSGGESQGSITWKSFHSKRIRKRQRLKIKRVNGKSHKRTKIKPNRFADGHFVVCNYGLKLKLVQSTYTHARKMLKTNNNINNLRHFLGIQVDVKWTRSNRIEWTSTEDQVFHLKLIYFREKQKKYNCDREIKNSISCTSSGKL